MSRHEQLRTPFWDPLLPPQGPPGSHRCWVHPPRAPGTPAHPSSCCAARSPLPPSPPLPSLLPRRPLPAPGPWPGVPRPSGPCAARGPHPGHPLAHPRPTPQGRPLLTALAPSLGRLRRPLSTLSSTPFLLSLCPLPLPLSPSHSHSSPPASSLRLTPASEPHWGVGRGRGRPPVHRPGPRPPPVPWPTPVDPVIGSATATPLGPCIVTSHVGAVLPLHALRPLLGHPVP